MSQIMIKFDNGSTLIVDVSTPDSQPNIHQLGTSDAIIFIFEDYKMPLFWNRDVPYDTSVIFVDVDFKICKIYDLKFKSTDIIKHNKPSKYIILIRSKLIPDLDLKVGTFMVEFENLS